MKNITLFKKPANDNTKQPIFISTMESLKNFLLKEQNKEGFVFVEDVYGRELVRAFNNQPTE
jgi:hypothetical protein